jgi:hypothetical protein
MPSMHTLKMIGFGFLSAAIGVILLINQYVIHCIYLPEIFAAIMILIAAITMLCTEKISEKLADFFLVILGLVLFLVPIFNTPILSTVVVSVIILIVGVVEIIIGLVMA